MCFVKVEGLYKNYGKASVLEDINCEIRKGEFVTLLGPSGCGKSTLLRCIAGLAEVNSGSIFIEERKINGLSPKDRNVSMVFQSYALFPNMNVKENISFGLKMKKMKKEEIEKKVSEVLSLVELKDKEGFYPSQLSGGQQQRVALARAIIMEPKVLLMDEPLSALDAKIRKNLRIQLRHIQKKLDITTIFVTHDQEEALTVSDRIFLMNSGKIVQSGPPYEIYAQPENEFAARFMGSYNIIVSGEIKDLASHPDKNGIYAVRPESINISDTETSDENSIRLVGKISDRILLGNVVRYRIKTAESSYTVDILNRKNEEWFKEGEQVNLYIPIEELKKIG